MTFCVRLGWEAISSLKIAASLAKPKIKFRLTRQPSTLLTAKSLLKPAWSCTTAWKHQKAPARGALGTLTRCALACRSPCLQRLSSELMAQGLSSGGLPNSDSALISRAFFLRRFKKGLSDCAWFCAGKRSQRDGGHRWCAGNCPTTAIGWTDSSVCSISYFLGMNTLTVADF